MKVVPTLQAIVPLLPVAYLALPILRDTTDPKLSVGLSVSIALSAFAFVFTKLLIPVFARYTSRAGLEGIDLNKKGQENEGKKIPEALGVVPGTIYLICVIIFQLIYVQNLSTPDNNRLVEYNAALTCIVFTVFLGFADDVMDLPWRYKLLLPPVACLPLLVAYAGPTNIVIPKPMRALLGISIDFGVYYKLYMGLLAVFCSNSINILAGINGLEAGQSFVIGCSVLVHNLLELDGPFFDEHLFSIFFMLPFVATTLGLLYHNWYPSSVFVGDTFTYFAGVTFAVTGILGHFTKTMLLFFIPQIINFLYSLPQLFGIVRCPRHRLPRFNPKTGKLEAIKSNLNLVNLFLWIFGPMTERTLCVVVLAFQILCCLFAFWVRYRLSTVFYDQDIKA